MVLVRISATITVVSSNFPPLWIKFCNFALCANGELNYGSWPRFIAIFAKC
jgi:hypothetical protein